MPQGESASVERIDGEEINYQPTLFNGLEKFDHKVSCGNMREWSQRCQTHHFDSPGWLRKIQPPLALPGSCYVCAYRYSVAIRHIIAKDRTQLKVRPSMETPEPLISETIRDIA